MYSISIENEIEQDNDSQNYDILNLNNFYSNKEEVENSNFEKAFYTYFINNNINNINSEFKIVEKDNVYYNSYLYKPKNEINSTNVYPNSDNDKINIDNINEDNVYSKKSETNINITKFKVNKINSKRETAFITFNTKLNKYITKKVNKKISAIRGSSKFLFTEENPLLSTKFTQCGIQKKLKEYLNKPIIEFIKKENLIKIDEVGLSKDSLFNKYLYELILEYYEYIYSNKDEFNKYFLDRKFVIRNKNFSKDGLINLNYELNSKKVYGYLDFFKIDINMKKTERVNNRLRFVICIEE